MEPLMADKPRHRKNGKRTGKARSKSANQHPREPKPEPKKSTRIRLPGLPAFVQDDLARVTPAAKVEPALQALAEGAKAFSKGQYGRALGAAEQAKRLAPRDPSARELIGLSAYRLEQWKTALTELRTFRRLTGDMTHVPIEMDVLRALGRAKDVESVWQELRRRRPRPAVMKEGKVVYASFLLDEGRPQQAWDVVNPHRLVQHPYPEDLRVWFVAARAAAASGNRTKAVKLRNAIVAEEPAFVGLDLLNDEISRV